MIEVGYYNGKIGPLQEMEIPMLDRACYFGDGVYDFSLCHNGRIFALDEHIDRLYRSASMIDIEISSIQRRSSSYALSPPASGIMW